jgi:hypothetical protein
METNQLDDIQGASDLVAWFGYWPTFHDAEVLDLQLERTATRCLFRVHAFRMTPETDDRGYFICDRHVVVSFECEDVTSLEIDGFNHQNALMGLELSRTSEGAIRLELEPAYGLGGVIEARGLRLTLAPGVPPDSIYAAKS